MKLLKNFEPLPSDDGDEFYPNGIFVFNITKLIQHISKNQDVFQAAQVKVNTISSYSTTHLNEDTIMTADLAVPIIMAEISPDQFNVIDGHHRLEKARRENVEAVLAYKITAEHHYRFLTSTKAYEQYVEYWNSKLKEREKYNAI
ncbi:hypothetical protein FOG18_02015 [Legionella israelensis]|uniref:ParB N-terminal domain-containing protein n=1 Tax=Legionella israelensis TaxID=454 RepID=UPI0011815FC9|nr:ParB N-terminal domain-containing protein [Legionella israelensis]QDP73547.1 hypothetical protein FOG18_02015 [Legionella israelensis]